MACLAIGICRAGPQVGHFGWRRCGGRVAKNLATVGRDWTKPQLPFRHRQGGIGFSVRHRPTFFDLAQFSKRFNLPCLSFGR